MLTSVDYSFLTKIFAHFLQHSCLHSTATPYFLKFSTVFDTHDDFNKVKRRERWLAQFLSKPLRLSFLSSFWPFFTLPWRLFYSAHPWLSCCNMRLSASPDTGSTSSNIWYMSITYHWIIQKHDAKTAKCGLYTGLTIFSVWWTVTLAAKGLCFWLLYSRIILQYHCMQKKSTIYTRARKAPLLLAFFSHVTCAHIFFFWFRLRNV